MGREPSQGGSARFTTRGLGVLGGVLFAVAAIAFFAFRGHDLSAPYSAGYGQLLDSSTRPLEPRLSGAHHSPLRTSGSRNEAWERALRSALISASKRPSSGFTSSEFGERAGLSLLRGCPRSAISDLHRAISLAPRDPRLWADLSAAYLLAAKAAEAHDADRREDARRCGHSGMVSDEGLDALDALEAASTAIEFSAPGSGFVPIAATARFNRALALEALHLDRQAVEAWDEAAAAERDDGWAAEINLRRTTLAASSARSPFDPQLERRVRAGDSQAAVRLVQDDPQRARELAGRDLPWEWAGAEQAGREAEAGRYLLAVGELAAPLADHGDRVAADTVEALRHAAPSVRSLAARGLSLYAEGWPSYRSFENEKAIAAFDSSRRDLAAAGLPQALEVELYQAVAEHNAGRPGAEARVATIEGRLAGRGYVGLSALATRIRALLAGRDGRPHEAAEGYRQSRDLYDRLGEASLRATVESLLAQQLEKLGRRRDAWTTYLGAAAVAPRVDDPYLRRTIWGQLTFFAQAAARLRSALALEEEMQRAAAEQGDPNAVNEALLLRAAMRAASGDASGAGSDLSSIRGRIPSIRDAGDRTRTQADLARVEGILEIDRAPAEAARHLDFAVDHYDSTGQRVLEATSRAARARARARTAAGDLPGAEADLVALVALADRGGKGWLDEALDEDRYTFGRETRRAFSEMVRFQAVEAHRPWKAFAYAETARELLAPHPPPRVGSPGGVPSSRPPTLATLRAALPAETVLVEFAVFDDQVISWLVAPEGASSFITKVSRETITRLVESLNPTKGNLSDEAWSETSARLFDLLLRPLYSRLGRDRTLVVVPDGPLGQVPWSGLRDRERGRYVIEDRAVLVNPSASFYLRALARSRELDSQGPPKILVVGDPAFDTKEWPHLMRLPAARKEAAEIGAIYGSNATVLAGENATWDAFRKAAPDADVIHLGMHASLDPIDPFRSFLLFADPGASGARTLRDFAALDLPKTRLAILAACESAGESSEGEGVVGLARPFLAAGVPTVVGSLWPVGDRVTKFFSLQLHLASRRKSSVSSQSIRDLLQALQDDRLSTQVERTLFVILGSDR